MPADKALTNHLKRKISSKVIKIKDVNELVVGKFSDIKETTQEQVEIGKELASYQAASLKSEARFLKQIFGRKDMVFTKTEATAVVLRKLGANEEFLELFDKLTREGYWLVHKESVRNIPIGFGMNYPLGSLYFFQHRRYILGESPRDPNSKQPEYDT